MFNELLDEDIQDVRFLQQCKKTSLKMEAASCKTSLTIFVCSMLDIEVGFLKKANRCTDDYVRHLLTFSKCICWFSS
jgi:hypothetical protein